MSALLPDDRDPPWTRPATSLAVQASHARARSIEPPVLVFRDTTEEEAKSALSGLSTGKPGVVMGDPAVLRQAYGILPGVAPYGFPPIRGSRELMIAAKHDPTLFSITTTLGHDIAAVGWHLYLVRDASGLPSQAAAKRLIRRLRVADRPAESATAFRKREKRLADIRREENAEEIFEHPWLDMMDSGNPHMVTGQQAMAITQIYLDTQGECFWILQRNAFGAPIQYYPVPPYWCYRTPYRGFPYFHFIFGTFQAQVPERDVVWLKHLDPENPYARGTGPGNALADEIDADEYASKTISAFFYNHAIPPYLITILNGDPDMVAEAEESWNQSNRSYWNANRIKFTTGDVKVFPMSPNFVETKVIDLRKFLREHKMHTYGVPPEMLGINEHANRSTIETATFIYAEKKMKPRLDFLRGVHQRRVLPEYGEGLVADYESPTPDDQEFQSRVMGTHQYAFMVDEMRELADKKPLGGKDGAERPPMPIQGNSGAVSSKPLAPPRPITSHEPEQEKGAEREGETRSPEEKAGDGDSDLSEEDIPNILRLLVPEQLSVEMDPFWRDKVSDWAQQAAGGVGASVSFEMLNPLVSAHVAHFLGDRLKDINETTREELKDEMVDGISAGEGVDDLAKRIRQVFDRATDTRSVLIARTEVIRSSNWASTTAYRLSGVVKKREWVATPDDRTRDEHADMDGQVVGIGESFEAPGGEEADYPGGFGVAELDVNCRCTTAPVVGEPSDGDDEGKALDGSSIGGGGALTGDDPADPATVPVMEPPPRDPPLPSTRGAFWKRFDASVRPWEADAQRAFRRGFAKQREAAVRGLHEAVRG